MKKPIKISAITGFLLFALAAFFSITLLLVLGDIAGPNPARANGLYKIGKIFTSMYGVSSALIPIFLVVAAIQCFTETWSVRRGVILLGSLLPFFTVDAIEHFIRMEYAADVGAVLFIKLSAIFLLGFLVLAAEYLLLSFLGDVIQNALENRDDDEDASDYAIDTSVVLDDITGAALPEADENAATEEPVQKAPAEKSRSLSEAPVVEAKAAAPASSSADWENPFAHVFDAAPEARLEAAVEKEEPKKAEATPSSEIATLYEAQEVSEEEQAVIAAQSAFLEEEPETDASLEDDYLVPPEEYEEPHYNEAAAEVRVEEDEPAEMIELDTFDPDVDSYDGYSEHVEEVSDAEIVDEDIDFAEKQDEALSAENADAAAEPETDFNDDFYDIDLNAEDEDEYAAQEDAAENQKETDEILPEDQKSTSLNDIFAEMDDDAAREPMLYEPAVEKTDVVMPEEPILDEENAIDEMEIEETVSGEIALEELDEAETPEEADAEDDFVEIEEPDVSLEEEDIFAEDVPEPAQEDDVPVVDPLAPPVVDADGNPYEETEPDASLKDEAPESVSEPSESSPAPATKGGLLRTASAMVSASEDAASDYRVPAATFTVTAASPASAAESSSDKAHNDAFVSEPVRRRTFASYSIPTEGVLDTYSNSDYQVIDAATRQAAEALKETLNEFKIEAEVTGIRKGPVVTMFELLPAPGVKLSKIVALQDNIALRLAASSVRIVAPIPGKHAVGIEVPNKERAIVSFKEIIEQDLPQFKKMAIPVVLGKDISGEAQLIDLAKTPHLLIAGSTGAGKSVCVNTMILSILYKRSPDQVKLIMIDPKIVELKLYNDIPHLLTPVITEPKKAFQSLQYCLCEMERRYALLDGMGVRDITSYNNRIVERHIATEKLPYIVVIIDEFADLMATTGKELETTLARLAAMSRAVGIHLVLATQRPSIDVITGLIKANIPSRIAFMVASKMDSRIIIDQVGAEKLLGKGDMLYASATDPFPVRIQGTLVNDNEVERVVNCVKEYGEPDYIDDEIFVDDEEGSASASLFNEEGDPLYDEALEIVLQAGKASASYIQRRLKIGYNRAARLVEEMEERGIVGPANGAKPREIIHMPS